MFSGAEPQNAHQSINIPLLQPMGMTRPLWFPFKLSSIKMMNTGQKGEKNTDWGKKKRKRKVILSFPAIISCVNKFSTQLSTSNENSQKFVKKNN